MTMKILTGAVATLLASAAVAGAATLSLIGATGSQTIAGNDLGLGLNGQTVDFIDGAGKAPTNGLSLDGPADLIYTYLGFEAGNQNFASVAMGSTTFANGSATVGSSAMVGASAGLLDFAFGTTAPAANISTFSNDGTAIPSAVEYAIGYVMLSSTSYLLLFDDIAAGDRDFDDIALRVDVAPVPLPAAGLLLVGGLGVLGAMKRRRKAA